MFKKALLITLSVISAISLSACPASSTSNSSGGGGGTSSTILSSSSSTVAAGFLGPATTFTVTVDQSSGLQIPSGSVAVSNLAITSGLPSGVTASYTVNAVTSTTSCANVPLGDSCTISLTSNISNPSQDPTIATLHIGGTYDSAAVTTSVTLGLTWPTLLLSNNNISATGANNVTVTNLSTIPAEITSVTSLTSGWTIASDTCNNATLNLNDSCQFSATIDDGAYTLTGASITITGSNLDPSSPSTGTVNTVLNTAPSISSNDYDPSSSTDITFTGGGSKTIYIQNSNDLNVPVTMTDISSTFNTSFDSNCTGSATSFIVNAQSTCTITLQPKSSTDSSTAITVDASGTATHSFNLIIPGSVDITSGHADESYPAYEYIEVTNNTSQNVTSIALSLPSNITSAGVAALSSSDAAPSGGSADTCSGATLTNSQSCKIWLYDSNTVPTAAVSGNAFISYDLNGTPATPQTQSISAATYLYIGGTFTTIPGVGSSLGGIAKWDGSRWSAVSSTGANNNINALKVDGYGNLYVGGLFTSIGGISTSYFSKWNGASWIDMNGSALSGPVWSITTDSSNNVYAGGGTTTPEFTGYVTKWDNGSTTGMTLTDLFNDRVFALNYLGSTLYAGGAFTTLNGANNSHFAKLESGTWSEASAVSSNVNALSNDGTNIYVGANAVVTTIAAGGSYNINAIGKWNPGTTTWSPLGTNTTSDNGVNGAVNAIANSSVSITDGTYLGGAFTTNGTIGTILNYIGVSANNLIPGTTSGSPPGVSNGIVYAVISTGTVTSGTNYVYYAGSFNQIPSGGVSANRIARLTSPAMSLSPLSDSLSSVTGPSNGQINALAIGSYLQVGS